MSSSSLLVPLKPAALLAQLGMSAHLCCFICVLLAPAQLLAKLISLLVLLLSCYLLWRQLSGQKQYQAINIGENGISLFDLAGKSHPLILRGLYISRVLVLIRYQRDGLRLPGALLLLPQNTYTEQDFRRLYISLKQLSQALLGS